MERNGSILVIDDDEATRSSLCEYLAAAGYDPKSMVDFMKLMRRYEFYSNNIPSYFLTHPGTSDRIRYLDGLLEARYTMKGKESIVGGFRRVQVEIEWFIALSDAGLPEFAPLSEATRGYLRGLVARFSEADAQAIKDIEASMSAPGFYDDRDAAKPIIDRHQALMWEVGDLMHQWEELQTDM